jgi:transketolase
MTTGALKKKAAQLRLDTLTAIHQAGEGHSGACMSAIEIVASLYYGDIFGKPVMKYDSARPDWQERDYFVLSKVEAQPLLNVVLRDLGFDLGDEDADEIVGPAITAAAPGEGLALAMGVALGLKMDRQDNRVFTVLSDQELLQGRVWEAALQASRYRLGNLVAFIDDAKLQIDPDYPDHYEVDRIQDKFEAFGWKVIQITDGHDFDKLLDGVQRAFTETRRPVAIWCHTISGKGIDFAEYKRGYRDVALSSGELSAVVPKLKSTV